MSGGSHTDTHINDQELLLLAHLHEHAKGTDADYPFNPSATANATYMQMPDFEKAVSYLAELGLVGVEKRRRRPAVNATARERPPLEFVWLTGTGENFCRVLEAQLLRDRTEPSFGGKLTTTFVKGASATFRILVTATITEFVKSRLMHP